MNCNNAILKQDICNKEIYNFFSFMRPSLFPVSSIFRPGNRGKLEITRENTVLAEFKPEMWVLVFMNHNFSKT